MSYRYKIIDASAGTGKTFSLRKNILLKLFSADDFSFKQILAVTFTNNASNEMKQSILSDLFVISNNPKKSKVLAEINKEIEIKNVQEKSKKLLRNILNNFSFFQICTLDKFNHRLIRSFSAELGLGYDFELIVDRDEFYDLLIFEFLDKIEENKPLLSLLSNYSKTKVNQNKSWDIDFDMRALFELIFDETNYVNFLKLSENENLNFYDLKKDILKKTKSIHKSMNLKTSEFHSIVEQISEHVYAYIKNFISNVENKQIKGLKTENVRSRLLNSEILKKSYNKDQAKGFCESIIKITNEVLDSVEKLKTYTNIISNIELNILAVEIIKFSNHFQEEANILFISDFNKKINKELLDNPSQYIYEKLSVKFKDYFIDEFQDTSFLQWQNIIPLSSHSILNEGINETHGSIFLVGDPKQSIYRWRGANPEIFSSLKKTSPFHLKPELIPKKINFRSKEQIVKFNNEFFKFIASKLDLSRVDELYANLDQRSNKASGGLTTFSFIDKQNEYEEQTNLSVLNIVKDKIKKGYDYKDIAILCRKNDQCSKISSFLIENKIDVKSDEISTFSSVKEVEILVRFLALKTDSKNRDHVKEILKYFAHTTRADEKYAFIQKNINNKVESIFSEILGLDFMDFYNCSDYESAVYLINNLEVFDANLLYIQFLLDEILNHESSSYYKKENFYTYWNKKKEKLKATFSNDTNSVNVLTIHKAKGMQFKVVILPFFDFNLQKSNFKVWIEYESPKIKTPIFIDYSSSLKYFNRPSKIVYEEKNDEMILDSLNLVYVALSRAIDENHIVSYIPKNPTFSNVSGICHSFTDLETYFQYNKNATLYNYLWGLTSKIPNKASVLTEKLMKTLTKVEVYESKTLKKLFNKSKNTSHFGSLFHNIMSKIESKNQIEIVTDEFFNRGLISNSDKNKLIKMIKSIFNNKKLSHFFEGKENVYNEREIYLSNNSVIKPDRIIFHGKKEVSILDYKTGKPKKSDEIQVMTYVSELKKSSYQVKEAKLLYMGEKLKIKELIKADKL